MATWRRARQICLSATTYDHDVAPLLAGRYEIRRRLGRGGMATVYEAYDELLDRAVAIKLLDSSRMDRQLDRFGVEARAAATLTHPHVVAVYDVGIQADLPFIVLELVRGTTLQHALDRGGVLATRHAVAVGSQLLAALQTAHDCGLVHRDVKPANVLLPDGALPSRPNELPGVKLADFGIAKVLRGTTVGLTTAGQVIGTPRYMSPEQVRGERATPRSDLYAVAVVLFEMLAGRAPFEYDDPIAVAMAHKDEYPPPLAMLRPDLDPRLVALVHRTLAKRPDLRPASARRMRSELLASSGPPGPAAKVQVSPTKASSGPAQRDDQARAPLQPHRSRPDRRPASSRALAIAVTALVVLIMAFVLQLLL